MAASTRPGAASSAVARALAVTAGWRVTGLVTRGPMRMRRVFSATPARFTYNSRRIDWLSVTPKSSKPHSSANCAHAM